VGCSASGEGSQQRIDGASITARPEVPQRILHGQPGGPDAGHLVAERPQALAEEGRHLIRVGKAHAKAGRTVRRRQTEQGHAHYGAVRSQPRVAARCAWALADKCAVVDAHNRHVIVIHYLSPPHDWRSPLACARPLDAAPRTKPVRPGLCRVSIAGPRIGSCDRFVRSDVSRRRRSLPMPGHVRTARRACRWVAPDRSRRRRGARRSLRPAPPTTRPYRVIRVVDRAPIVHSP